MKSARRWRTASEFFSGETKERKKERNKQLKKKTIERRAWENLWTGRKKDREEKESFFHSTFFKVMKGRMEKLAA